MASYSTSVALFDFLPVLISAGGLILLARAMVPRLPDLQFAIWAVALAVPFGGLCKASWKLIVALTEQRLDWLENLLFIAMAPGFVGLAYALCHSRRAWIDPSHRASLLRMMVWIALPLLLAGVAYAAYPAQRIWFFCLLAVTTLANASLLVHAIRSARTGRLPWGVSAAFLINFAATLALSGLSRLPDTETTAWIQEGVNLLAQSALAGGLWHLARRLKQPLPTRSTA